MEIKITKFFDLEPSDFYGSVMSHGLDAAKMTWNGALLEAKNTPLLETPDQILAVRLHLKHMGFSEDSMTMPEIEIQALFLQLIAADLLENPLDEDDENNHEDSDNSGSSIFKAGKDYYFYAGE